MKLGRSAIVVWAWACGCGPVVGSEGTDGTDDSGDSGSPTTTATSTTAGTATTAGTTMTTVADTSTSTTTGQPVGCSGDWVSGCQAFCAVLLTCIPDAGVYEECVMDCVNGLVELGGDCQIASCEYYTCLGMLDCATFENGSPECEELGYVVEAVCYGGDSSAGDEDGGCYVGAGPDGQCEYGCTEGDRRFSCDKEVCTCYEDGVAYAGCPSNGICETLDGLEDHAVACCGW